jgi:carbamoyltransferase
MNILGVAFLSDASACVLRDGRLVAAVSEERLNRVKLWHGIPQLAISRVLDLAGLTLDRVDVVATHGLAPNEPNRAPFESKDRDIRASALDDGVRDRQIGALWSRYDHERSVLGRRTPAYIADVKALGRPMRVYAHHHAHAATALFGVGWEQGLGLTADGWGEDGSSSLWHLSGLEIARLSRTETFDSLGYFYGSITKALGFVPHRHEGKVLGLAAHGRDPKSYRAIRDMIDVDIPGRRFLGRMDRGLYSPRFENPALQSLVSGYAREDVAAAAQRSLEEVVTSLAGSLGDSATRLALAGGVFANVKLNQRLAELDNVREVFVFPNMGDGGLSVGAAWLAHVELTGRRPEPLKTCYLGPAPSEGEIGALLSTSGLSYRHEADIARRVAELLARDQVVARCTGAMEFGPRALGHRSILYHARDPSVNGWLNQRLNRSEFMPFAPATLAEDAAAYFDNLDAAPVSARYMTMTFDGTPKMRAEAPAAVHVDGTARPQLVSAEHNPDFYAILSRYRALTGHSNVINTSFNMHEEPIVCTAEDALRAFKASGLPYLALGDFLVEADVEPVMP